MKTDIPDVEQPAFRLAAVGAVIALAVGAFCFLAMEMLPIGLLPLICADFGVSLSGGGMLISGYGLTVAVVSVPLAYATRRIPRRRLITVLLTVLVVATVASGLAGNFATLLGARLVVALSQSVFWSVVGPAAASLFPVRVRGKATAIVFGGSAMAPMLGVPAGTWLGQQVGWQWPFFGVAGFGVLACVLVAALMPTGPAGQGHASTGTAPDARRYVVVLVMTVTAVAGIFTAFTYTTPFLTDVTGFSASAVGPLLLIRGVVSFAGIVLAGFLVDRNLRTTLILAVALMAVSLLGAYAFAASAPLTLVFLAVSGFAHGLFPPALQNLVMEVAPGNADVANAGDSAAFNVGIAGGALIGGLTLDTADLAHTALVGAVIVGAALAVVLAEPALVRLGRSPAAAYIGSRGASRD